ncbi:MAG: hypothetical protein OEN01_14270, partial [Candidatus Krumholzibacteria bacterium]|nr:hypothetical protein [Candidatus Krumholzibacteria bacterium]
SLLAALAIPSYNRFTIRAKETRVRANCHTVQLAAEDFAIQNDGNYAADTDTDLTLANQTIRDLLPQGAPLENPFTKVATEPRSSGAAVSPGETGYVVLVGPVGTNDGYTITGFGATRVILTVANGQ